jgi:hypothetical protein
VEENITSQYIWEKIQNMFQALHFDVSTHQKNPFTSLKNNFGFSLINDKSTIANAGNGNQFSFPLSLPLLPPPPLSLSLLSLPPPSLPP